MTASAAVHFLLVPDAGAARRLRRQLASSGARTGVVVGVWPELITLALDSAVLSPPVTDWSAVTNGALAAFPDAFWSGSYANAPGETCSVVCNQYLQLLQETEPETPFTPLDLVKLAGRGGAHLADLVRFHQALDGALPDHLAAIQALLHAPQGLRPLCVYTSPILSVLSTWQVRLLEHLNTTSTEYRDTALQVALDAVTLPPEGLQASGRSLTYLQRELFDLPEQKGERDNSVQWLAVRDFYEEAEVAAGMVQSILASDETMVLADIGILVPNRLEYIYALRDAFALARLPLSGLGDPNWRRDLGRELILHFLQVREKPAPAMAVAACLTSPLMPWSETEGATAAQRVIDGDWRISAWRGISRDGETVLELLRGEDSTGASLGDALGSLVRHLPANEALTEDLLRAAELVEAIGAELVADRPVDWSSVRRLAGPDRLEKEPATEFTQEGVTVWHEGREAWRPVRHLLVLGFASGHYSGRDGASPVLSETDIRQLAEQTGLRLVTRRARLDRDRAYFKRQLNMVAETASFLIPRRDPAGDAQSPSESLEFILYLFGEEEDAVLSLDLSVDRAQVRFLPVSDSMDVIEPSCRPFGDLEIGQNLLALRTDADGNPKPESPSALETLMVSPLAWLLQRLKAEPTLWIGEKLDVLLQGTLAHGVFELVFEANEGLPERRALPGQVRTALEAVIREESPFLRSAAWAVERHLLEGQLVRAAEAWRDILAELGADVIGTEVWLHGQLGKLGIHGQSDALLALPGDRLLIVDYKKSSASSRRDRMLNGYDSQVELYRRMLQTGGLKEEGTAGLADRLQASADIGVVYFNLNDATALSDSNLAESSRLPGWEWLDNDVSAEAIALIERRVADLEHGRIVLNRAGDQEFFEKQAGVKPYALEVSSLITLFMPADGEGVA